MRDNNERFLVEVSVKLNHNVAEGKEISTRGQLAHGTTMVAPRVFLDFAVDGQPVGRYASLCCSTKICNHLCQSYLRIVQCLRAKDGRKVRVFIESRASFSSSATVLEHYAQERRGLSAVSSSPLYYKNSIVHRSIKDFMIQGGGVYTIVVRHSNMN